MITSKYKFFILIIFSTIITLFVVKLSYNVSRIYNLNYPNVMDPAAYMSENINLLHKIESDKSTNSEFVRRIKFAARELKTNYVYPLRTEPLILFSPKLLGKRWGHLYTTIPMFFIFILIFCYSVYSRTNNIV